MAQLDKPKYIPGIGPSNAKIAIVGEAPGYDEDKEGIPFVGQSGRLLDRLLKEADLNRKEIYVTNVIKYRPPGNNIKNLSDINIKLEEQELNLKKELIELDPNLIIALGNTPLKALTGKKGISKYRGSILQAHYGGFKVLPTYHPAALLWAQNKEKWDKSGYESTIGGETIVITDLIKAKKNSLTKDFETVKRNLQIVKDEYTLYKLLQSYKDVKLWSLDIESQSGIPICLGLAPSPYHAFSIPLLSIAGVGGGINILPTELAAIYKTLSEFLNRSDIKFIGQNLKYDLEKLQWPSLLLGSQRGKVAADTSIMMGIAYTEFPKNLAFMTSLFTNEPYYKDEGREFNSKKNKAEDLLIYNCKDAAITYEIKNALDKELDEFSEQFPAKPNLKSFYYNYANKLHDFYNEIEMEGLNVDFDRRTELLKEYTYNLYTRQERLNSLIGREFNVRSNPTVRKVIEDDLGLPSRPNYQEDTIVALIGNHTEAGSKESEVLGLILEIRQIKTNLNYLKAEPDPDGIMRTTYRITGTETGRSSTGVLKAPLRPIPCGLPFQTIPKHGPFSKAIRSIFVPPEGYVFLEADLSQAEARIVAILADDDVTLSLFDSSDIHSLTASWIFGKDPKEIDKVTERFIGKTVRHAGNYGMAKRRLMLDTNATAKKFNIPVQLSEKRAQEILDIFHGKTPKIRKVFQAEVKLEVGKTRTLFNPYGRMRQFYGNLKDEELYAQIPQSTVPDSVRRAGLRIKDRIPGIRICLEGHDALLFKIRKESIEAYAKIIKEELEEEIDFKYCSLSRGKLKIPAEIQVGNRYSELEKLKL